MWLNSLRDVQLADPSRGQPQVVPTRDCKAPCGSDFRQPAASPPRESRAPLDLIASLEYCDRLVAATLTVRT